MKNKELAEFHGVTISAVNQWSAETKRRKIIEAQAGAEPEICALIAEISRLCYVFDCHSYECDKAKNTASFSFSADVASFYIQQWDGKVIFSLQSVDLNASTAVAELQKVKQTLESFIY